MSTPWASMSASRSSGVIRTLGEVKPVRLPLVPRKVPSPSPGSWRKPYHSRPASAARQSEAGTRWAWISMDFMRGLLWSEKSLTCLHRKYTVSGHKAPWPDGRRGAQEAGHGRDDRGDEGPAGED